MHAEPLAQRSAIVTGASRGIGAATARALDAAGARVALVGRDREALELVAASLGHDPVILTADLRDATSPAMTASRALESLGAVDIVVNSAGVATRLASSETDAALIDDVFAINVRATLLMIAAVIPAMVERRGGSIINLSSISGIVGTPRRMLYAATKGAIDAATRSLAIELGPSGIRVNAVAPGVVDTNLWAANKQVPGVVELIERQTPLRRWGTAEDVASVIVFLASDAARFVTGETISVDGGMAKTMDLYAGTV